LTGSGNHAPCRRGARGSGGGSPPPRCQQCATRPASTPRGCCGDTACVLRGYCVGPAADLLLAAVRNSERSTDAELMQHSRGADARSAGAPPELLGIDGAVERRVRIRPAPCRNVQRAALQHALTDDIKRSNGRVARTCRAMVCGRRRNAARLVTAARRSRTGNAKREDGRRRVPGGKAGRGQGVMTTCGSTLAERRSVWRLAAAAANSDGSLLEPAWEPRPMAGACACAVHARLVRGLT
jgi:hypothetical protein